MESNDNIFSDFKCSICLVQFDNLEHKPFMLKCGHNLCMKSIQKIVKINRFTQTTYIKCPLCKQQAQYQGHTMPYGIGKNFALINIMEKFTQFNCIPIKEPLSNPLIKKIDELKPMCNFIQKWPELVKKQLIKEERHEFYEQQQEWSELEEKRRNFLKYKENQMKEVEQVESLLKQLTIQIQKTGFSNDQEFENISFQQDEKSEGSVEEQCKEPSPPPPPSNNNISHFNSQNRLPRSLFQEDSDENDQQNGDNQLSQFDLFLTNSQFDVVPETTIINAFPQQQQQSQTQSLSNVQDSENTQSQPQNLFQN